MKFIVGKKINMTQQFGPDGNAIPVTVVRVTPAIVTQVKTADSDGYGAVQLGFNAGPKNPTRAVAGHVKGVLDKPLLREFRIDDPSAFSVGQRFDIGMFATGEKVSVTGVSKGRGFQGVVKRHGFHGAPKTHGHKHDNRAPGSIGSTDAQRVFPGRRMAGRMGGDRVTILNLEIAGVDTAENVCYIRGAVPGARGGIVIIRAEGEMKSA